MNQLDGSKSTFGTKSMERLSEVEPALAEIILEVSKWMDITVVCGHRDEEAQTAAFEGKKSQLEWPESKHNSLPSRAIDIAPYNLGIDWNNIQKFMVMIRLVKIIAQQRGVKLRFGADFKSFKDYPHIELRD